MKILLVDLEVAPNLATVWGIWQQNVALNQLLESSYIMCYAAKWYGEPKMYFDSVHKSSKKDMLKGIHAMMDEADAIVHYNGNRFDIPMLHKEFLEENMPPPSPSKHIDLLQTAKRQFRFVSNKLDYVAQRLGLGKKTDHEGHELWLKCMNGDRKAWKKMEEYNRQDVILLEAVYVKFRGWIPNHPNHNAYDANSGCVNCGSSKIQHRGYTVLISGKYRRMQCQACGTWFRSNKKEQSEKSEKFVKV